MIFQLNVTMCSFIYFLVKLINLGEVGDQEEFARGRGRRHLPELAEVQQRYCRTGCPTRYLAGVSPSVVNIRESPRKMLPGLNKS